MRCCDAMEVTTRACSNIETRFGLSVSVVAAVEFEFVIARFVLSQNPTYSENKKVSTAFVSYLAYFSSFWSSICGLC